MTAQQSDTPGEATRLAAELRRLRGQAGLSFTELGEQTPYSRSAWQRYLTAKVLPPWTAVRDLCRLAGEPEPRLRALWELAESAFRGRGVVMAEPPETAGTERRPEPEPETGAETETAPKPMPMPGADTQPGTEPVPGSEPAAPRENRGRVDRAMVLIAVTTATAMAAAGVYFLRGTGTGSGSPSSRPTTGRFSVSCTSGSCDPTCQGAGCNGQDPQLTLCGVQGRPLTEQVTAGGVGLEIRYNPRCRAAWARFWNTHVGDTLTLTTPGQPAEAVRVADPRYVDAFTYTPLIYVAGSGTALKVCIRSGSGAPDCFTATAA